uniref:Uncharacterized protein n=1 Tax=Panagrolaimus sp. JU765 TaxID=591449 RepID=A0AC34R1F6_9BILA
MDLITLVRECPDDDAKMSILSTAFRSLESSLQEDKKDDKLKMISTKLVDEFGNEKWFNTDLRGLEIGVHYAKYQKKPVKSVLRDFMDNFWFLNLTEFWQLLITEFVQDNDYIDLPFLTAGATELAPPATVRKLEQFFQHIDVEYFQPLRNLPILENDRELDHGKHVTM